MDDYIITILQLLLYNLNSRIIYFKLHLIVYPTVVTKILVGREVITKGNFLIITTRILKMLGHFF